eukprot:28127_1
MAAPSVDKGALSDSEAPVDYQEYDEDSELNIFLQKEDLLSLRSGLRVLNINLSYLKHTELESLNQLCDKLQLKIGSSTRLQFTRAVVKLQSEHKQQKLLKRKQKQILDEKSPTDEKENTKTKNTNNNNKPDHNNNNKSVQHIYTTSLAQPRPKGYDYIIKCILLGDSDVGKSCILLRYVDNVFKESRIFTVGIDYRLKTIELGDYMIKYQIWDTAGQEKYRTIISAYYRGIDAALLCYDITNRESFDNVRNWIESVVDQSPENVFMMLVGTKLDLVNNDIKERVVEREEGEELAQEYNIKFCEASSKSGHGINSLFLTTASYVVLNKKKEKEQIDKQRALTQETVDLMKEEQERIEKEELDNNRNPTDKFVKKKCCNFYI